MAVAVHWYFVRNKRSARGDVVGGLPVQDCGLIDLSHPPVASRPFFFCLFFLPVERLFLFPLPTLTRSLWFYPNDPRRYSKQLPQAADQAKAKACFLFLAPGAINSLS
jgi:hypothetical protein